jgi:hypothetical protein
LQPLARHSIDHQLQPGVIERLQRANLAVGKREASLQRAVIPVESFAQAFVYEKVSEGCLETR